MMQNAAGGGFHGWKIVGTAFVTLGLAVGVPYYNLPFFYDYFQRSFGWSVKQITLGFPLAAILTIWMAPVLIPRFSQRKLIVFGTGLTALCFLGFAGMRGAIWWYFVLFLVYTGGYMFSGPIPHQILVSHWFRRMRGRAMGFMYVGVGLFGGAGSFLVRELTDRFGFRTALVCLGALMLLVWPLAWFILRDTPAEMGQFPDGDPNPPGELRAPCRGYPELLRSLPFWLLLAGSVCSIGAIGSINQHMKLVFRDSGFRDQHALNAAWTASSVLILWSSVAGRIATGYLADAFSKRMVMTATYFVVATSILLLLAVSPAHPVYLYLFSVVFGFSMGADYMLIPLMAAERFGVNTLARAMAILLPVNTIGQTWVPYLVSTLRQNTRAYTLPMTFVFALAMLGALAIAVMPKRQALESN